MVFSRAWLRLRCSFSGVAASATARTTSSSARSNGIAYSSDPAFEQVQYVKPGETRFTDRFRPRYPSGGPPGSGQNRRPRDTSKFSTYKQRDNVVGTASYDRAPTNNYSFSSDPSSQARPGPRYQKPQGEGLQPVDWTPAVIAALPPFKRNFYRESAEVASRSVKEIRELLSSDKIVISGLPPIPKPIKTFEEAGLRNIEGLKQFEHPTPIQRIAIPVALSGRDFVAVSETGSGKTVAYLLPAIAHIQAQIEHQSSFDIEKRNKESPRGSTEHASIYSGSDEKDSADDWTAAMRTMPENARPMSRASKGGPVGLILAPTRELAEQIYCEAEKLNSKAMSLRIAAVFGGVSRRVQIAQLKGGVDLLIACPGRLIDFMETGVVPDLARTTYLVLDEADRMLDMGFEAPVRAIVNQIRPDRQTLFYSATWPREVEHLAREFCVMDPVKVQMGSSELRANPHVRHSLEVVGAYEKNQVFIRTVRGILLKKYSLSAKAKDDGEDVDEVQAKILVFTATKRSAEQLSRQLTAAGFPAVALHGDQDQIVRKMHLAAFRDGRRSVLVATDVASRGLDINNVTHVINYELPQKAEDFVHRVGRTGRNGKKGEAITYFESDDRTMGTVKLTRQIIKLVRATGQDIPEDVLNTGLAFR